MSKDSKSQFQNDTELTIPLLIIGGIIITVAIVFLIAFSVGVPG